MSGALVRMCKQHVRVLDERDGDKLWCPIGHWSASWIVRDRQTGKETDGGEEGETPATAPGPKPVAPQPRPQPPSKAAQTGAVAHGGRVVEATAFRADDGRVLRMYIRAMRGTVEKLYRVHWRCFADPRANSKCTSSNVAYGVSLEEAKDAFKHACDDAGSRGWSQKVLGVNGGKAPKFLPIPERGGAREEARMSFWSGPEQPSSDWPEVRAQASVIAARRIDKFERERAERIAGYALKWKPAAERHRSLLRFSREFRP